jgi:hypothetical protein
MNDIDCPVPNDHCKNATDISAGGTFQVDIPVQTAADSKEACSNPGPDVFYTFKLANSEYVYLSVLDIPVSGNVVPVALEIYSGGCPPPDGTAAASACDAGNFGERDCARPQFPLITSSTNGALAGKPLGPGTFFLAVRSFGGAGSFKLTFDHVPLQCAQQGEIIPPLNQLGQVKVGTTCQTTDNYQLTCETKAGLEDASYVIFKCPNQLVSATTCDGRTPASSTTTLGAMLGPITFDPTKLTCTGKQVACSPPPLRACVSTKGGVADLDNIGQSNSGIITLSVEVFDTATGGACGAYGIDAIRQ